MRHCNENLWFYLHQPLLLGMANTSFGRDLLVIPKEYPNLSHISRNSVTFQDAEGKYVTDFRIGAKWGNVIRSRWEEFNSYARYFSANHALFDKPVSNLVKFSRAVTATTSTIFPDPDPESATVDGNVYLSAGSFASAHDTATGDGANPSSAASDIQTSNGFFISRWIGLFDTSAIADTDVVSAAVFSLYVTGKDDSESDTMRLVSSNPASNTTLVAADFDKDDFGTTSLANNVTVASISTTAYNDWTLTDLTAVSKTGVTKLAIRTGKDVTNSAPSTGGNYISVINADTALTLTDPKLVVTHAAAPASGRSASGGASYGGFFMY